MPKKPIDYSNCCIYKIEHIENDTLIYVGHTTNFKQRKADHKKNCNNESNKKFNFKLYTMMRENGGFEMFKMIEVEKYPCNDRREADKRENEVMKELKSTMNKNRSFRTNQEIKENAKQYREINKEEILKKKKEYNEENKEKIKQNREENKEKIKDKNKEYYENNKEKFKEKHKQYYEEKKDKVKQYYEENKDKKKQYQKEYKEENKENIKEYYKNNKENYKDKNKQYREDNKDKIKQYREDKKEKINEYNKEYYLRKKAEKEKLFIE